jgi:hypothetical protein
MSPRYAAGRRRLANNCRAKRTDGLTRIARFDTRIALHLGDLTITGEPIDLASNPPCEPHGHRYRDI